ncbi:methylamine utilization protein MauJ [Collimonas sp. H4R21]|uniref:Methylamine utilization protein MauJ n=1 Tax=Collimonas rhizosphaerae TaxID=3126357 RepID=A0ABU9PQK8_9BURK
MANYEIRSELSVVEDGRWLKLQHPKGLFRARIRNIVRSDFSIPFLLSLHLTFEAPNLEEAAEVAEEQLVDCLSMLAFTTGSSFVRHRIRQIVDCTPGLQMRSCLMWGDSIGHEDPAPFLDQQITDSIDHLLTFDAPPVMRRAMRWYRMGINSAFLDDQFQCFWFALELIAISQKSSKKVPDQCPHCRSALYCETCKKHPVHKPYEKQGIRELIKNVDKDCDDATIEMLGKARNSLMHGATLREIEEELPNSREEIVDVLGKIVFMVLVNQFPKETFNEKVVFGSPSTYVHRTLTGVAHLQTVVPVDVDGEFDLSFSGTKISMVSDVSPQSARPTLLVMTLDQHKRLEHLCYEKGDHQEMCRRMIQHAETHGEQMTTVVLSTDMVRILDTMKRGDTGGWQDLFREILGDSKSDDSIG